MSFVRQLPHLLRELDALQDRPRQRRLSARRRLLAAFGFGLLSLGLTAASLTVALRLDARLALVFAPALLLTLVLVHDLGRPGGEPSRAI